MKVLFIGLCIGIIGLFAISPMIAYMTDETITVTVKDKERVVTGSGQSIASKFLVYTDQEVFENTDTVWYWKFDSADVQNSLEVGQTYQVRVYGFRVPFLSWFRNIESVNNK